MTDYWRVNVNSSNSHFDELALSAKNETGETLRLS